MGHDIANSTARRGFLAGLVAGAGGLGSRPAAAVPAPHQDSPRTLPAKKVRRGDLVVGPSGQVLRVSSARTVGMRRRLRCVGPDGDETWIGSKRGFGPRQPLVVLMRKVPKGAIPRGDLPSIDGGAP